MKQYTQYVPATWIEGAAQLKTGIKMAYTVCGPEDAPAVVLLHGVTDGRLAWVRIAPELAKRSLRVYVPELRGNGLTDKPMGDARGYTISGHAADITAFLNALGLEKVHVVGHSMGSLVAQELNVSAPERILSTTLIDSSACCKENPVLNWALHGDGQSFPGVAGFSETGLPQEFLQAWANAPLETEDYQNGMAAHLAQIPCHSWVALLTGLIAFDSRAWLKDISGRVLVIWADGDDTFPIEDQKTLLAGLTGCRLQTLTIKGAGHDVMRDVPQARIQVINAIADFVQGEPA